MKLIDTSTWKPSDPFETYQVYNGLDCCLTFEIHEELPAPGLIYDFERAMQGPALEMSLRGLRVDGFERQAAIQHLEERVARLHWIINRFADALWGKPLNPQSPKQKYDLLHAHLELPVTFKRNTKGERVPTTDRDALEKLLVYPRVRPLIRAILAAADLSKQRSTLRSEVDFDGRMRASYNVAGTETGRWSSSKNAFGTGTNLQNISDKLRRIFIADPGRKLAYLDLEQAESWIVALKCLALFGETNYLSAIQSGDLHTSVAKLVWPSLPWTGDNGRDRKIAEQPFYRDFSYRDMAKRGGHGTNYYGTPPTMAKHLKVDTKLIVDFQRQYFAAFPEIPKWHKWCSRTLTTEKSLTTILGMHRGFFGRPYDDTTLREFIAFEPQSVVGQLLNLAMWRVWHHPPGDVRLLAQLHDAILIDYPDTTPEKELDLLQNHVSPLMRTPLQITNSTFTIPNDIAVGWNWGKFNDDPTKGGINLGGLRKITASKLDSRTRPEVRGLDRVIPDFN